MQLTNRTSRHPSNRHRFFRQVCFSGLILAFAGLVVGFAGCRGSNEQAPSTLQSKPYAGTKLTLACPDPLLAADLKNRVAGWGAKHGVAVTVEAKPVAEVPAADLAVIPAAAVGRFAADGKLTTLPARVRQGDNDLKWISINEVYRVILSGWGSEVVGLPITGDGYVLVYRADRFAEPAHLEGYRRRPGTAGRELAAPATWEDLADIAGYFAEVDKKPTLPPIPADAGKLLTQFYQIAACYDRKAMTATEATKAGKTGVDEAAFGFQLDIAKGTPRVAGPQFVAALEWFRKTKPYRPAVASDDAVSALVDGPAVAAVLSLADLAKLRGPLGEMPKKFGIAPLPGSRSYFDPDGKAVPVPGRNAVPYLGAGTTIGVVFKSSANADAAWDFLAETAGLSGSLALLANDRRGYGPFRTEHTDDGRELTWIEHGLDAPRVRDLVKAMRQHSGTTSGNPTFVLRTPDQGELETALEKQVRESATGDVPAARALQIAGEAWTVIEAKSSEAEQKKWRRAAAGLQ